MLCACSPHEKASLSETAAPKDTGDPEDCALVEDVFTGIKERLASVETVVSLEWRIEAEGESFVRFVDANGTLRTVPARAEEDEGGTRLRALLLGLLPDTTYAYQLLLEPSEGPTLCGPERRGVTGHLPLDLPSISTSAVDPQDAYGGFTVTTVISNQTAWSLILNAKGQAVWALPRPLEGGQVNARSTLSRDMRSVIVAETFPVPPYMGRLLTLSLEGEALSSLPLPLGVDILPLPDGRVAYLERHARTFHAPSGEAQTWVGDSIVELDPNSGALRRIWDVFDDFSPEDPRFAREQVGGPEDWAHVNSLSFDVQGDIYLLTAEHPEGVLAVRRSDGGLDWMVHNGEPWGLPEELRPAPGVDLATLLRRPHSARFVDRSVLLFNRSETFETDSCAFASELSLDLDRWEVAPSWSWSPDTCAFVDFLGEAERLPNGNTQVIWSSLGRIDEVSASGEVIQSHTLGSASHMQFFGFGERTDALYAGGEWDGRRGVRPGS
jgi:hypothetical protein